MRKLIALLALLSTFGFGQEAPILDLDDLEQQSYTLDELAESGVDGLEIVGGGGEGSDNFRLAIQWAFLKSRPVGNGWQLSGTLAANVSEMDSSAVGGEEGGTLTDIGLTPVWSFTSERLRTSYFEPFIEAGIGLHYLSEKEVGIKTFSTNFQFGDHIGVGANFGPDKRYSMTYQFQHLSNGGIDAPNPGINFHLVAFGYRF